MNSQNRMNAGAEYVLYRIWAALQDRNGIHPESLLTCMGALAGYACQVCVRQTATLPGADPAKHALSTVTTRDGTTYLQGDALTKLLADNPLSVWALLRRAVQKAGKPLPDVEEISSHVTQTLGTGAFGVVRVPHEHRPRHSARFYLEQIWPQILPIAQRFCRKPTQLPVLFGIALQRAIEQTARSLNPTLGARIAMECAVAMSKVALPEASDDAPITPTVVTPTIVSAPPGKAPAQSALRDVVARMPASNKRKSVRDADETGVSPVWAFFTNIPPAVRMGAIASLAFVTVASAMWRTDPTEAPATPRTALAVRELPGTDVPSASSESNEAAALANADTVPTEQFTDASWQNVPAPAAADPPPSVEVEENLPLPPPPVASNSDGSEEVVPPSDLMASSDPQ